MNLLSIPPEWLAKLPQWTPVVYDAEGYRRCGFVNLVSWSIVDEGQRPFVGFRCPGLLVWLDLSELLTAAVVAARIVRPWQVARYNDRSLPDDARFLQHVDLGVLERAEMMTPLSVADMGTLARLARAAMGAA